MNYKIDIFNGLLASLARGVLYGGVQGFQVRKCIIITTQIFVIFLGIGEMLLLGQKK